MLLDDEPVAIAVEGAAPATAALTVVRRGAVHRFIEECVRDLVTIETWVHIAYGYDIRGEVIGETGTVSLGQSSDVIVKSNGAYSGHVPGDFGTRRSGRPSTPSSAPGLARPPSQGARFRAPGTAMSAAAATLPRAGVAVSQAECGEPIAFHEEPALSLLLQDLQ